MAPNGTETNENPRFQTNNTVSQKQQPKQQLSNSMQHMRYAVTVDSALNPSSAPSQPLATTRTEPENENDNDNNNENEHENEHENENDAYGVPASFAPIRNPASRSHDAPNNQKRTDPFAFGSRFLEQGDDIFEFNAWDHVSVDETYQAFSEEQYEKQRQDPVTEFDRQRFNSQPEKWWNQFYKNNKTNFFKDRKWLAQEFPVLNELGKEDAPPAVLLEVGAGAGNSAFPIMKNSRNHKLKIHACDFSKKAVELIRGHELYDEKYIQADVWDVASRPGSEDNGLPPGLAEGSVDVVLLIFIFSALSPEQWDQAVRNIWRVLKPGGQVLFRDYGRGDLAQVRFKKGRYMEENFYVRGDGTRVYFFEQEELEEIWGGKKRDIYIGNVADTRLVNSEKLEEKILSLDLHDPALDAVPKSNDNVCDLDTPRPVFEVAHVGVDRRMLVNRQRRLKMYRCWMQAVFKKAGGESAVPISALGKGEDEGQGQGEEQHLE